MGKATVVASSCALPALSSVTIPGKCRCGACGAWTSQRSGFRRVEDGESNTTKVTSTNSYAKLTINVRCSMKWTLSTWWKLWMVWTDGSTPQRTRPLIYLNGAGYRPEPNLKDSKMSDKQTEKTIHWIPPSSAVKQKSPKLCCVNAVRCAARYTPAGHYGYGCERMMTVIPRISSPALTAQEIAGWTRQISLPCRLRLSLFC